LLGTIGPHAELERAAAVARHILLELDRAGALLEIVLVVQAARCGKIRAVESVSQHLPAISGGSLTARAEGSRQASRRSFLH
jgi:hypothetical protein